MISRMMAACAAIGIATCFVCTAAGQAPKGRDQEIQSGNIVALAGAEPFQKELGLNDDVVAKINEIAAAYRKELEKERTTASGGVKFKDMSDADRTQFSKKMFEIRKGLDGRFVPQIQAAITPEQFVRLQQLSWQARGSQAFADPQVAKSLVLTKEQRSAIGAVNQEYGQKQRTLVTSGGGANRDDEVSKLLAERNTKATEVLTKEQQETLKSLLGRPFAIPEQK